MFASVQYPAVIDNMASNLHRRGPWSQAEDQYLLSLVQSQGALNWVRIASILRTRTPKQCRERYHQNLKPSLNHEPISAEEGIIIEQLVEQIGKRWAEIARRLPGRSDNAVKNWWNGSQNRRKRYDRRKANLHYERPVSQDAQHTPPQFDFMHPHHQDARGLPIPGDCRPLPPPLRLLNNNSIKPGAYSCPASIENPLPSPSMYSPDSEFTPSLLSAASDSGGSPYATSPRPYTARQLDLELPPLKIPTYSPQGSPSPTDRQLPPLSAALSDGFASNMSSPESAQEELSPPRYQPQQQQHHAHAQYPAAEYHYSPKSHLPTAPNSPIAVPYRPRPRSKERDEKGTRVSVSRLLE